MITVEVVYATEQFVEIINVNLDEGSTVLQAIEISDIRNKYPGIEVSEGRVGIYSKICHLDDVVSQGDRIEIYRPLRADPKEARRLRAERQKSAQN